MAVELLDLLRQAAGTSTLDYSEAPQRLTGGFWAELFMVRVNGAPDGWPKELVVRVMPDPAVAAKETLIQAEVARLGFPTPAVRAAGGPGNGIGRAFMVMDRAAGNPLHDGLDGTKALARLPRLATTIPGTLATAMARLHRLNPATVRERLAGSQVATTVDDMLDTLEAMADEEGRTDLAAAARWFRAHPPPPRRWM
jgi:aminoglycoside phosphotransferase (APT) family kinase protein